LIEDFIMLTRRDFLVRASTVPLVATGVGAPMLFAGEKSNAFPGMIVRMAEPENLEFPFSSLSDFITTNEQFYIRSHFAVPKIDVKTWKLSVDGAVKQKREFTLDDLLRLPSRKLTATLECAGNGRVFLKPAVPGLQWGPGAVGNAEWGGIPLATILDKVGLADRAIEVILEGADKGQINSDPKSPGPIAFARSIPIEKANSDSVLLATHMNGKPLPVSHGAPLRAIVGGWYGVASVKWLSRIIVADKPYRGFWQTLDYSYWERKDGLPTLLPIRGNEVKATIARPSLSEVVPAGMNYRVFGAAWAGEAAVAKVEVSTDTGRSWNEAKLLDTAEPQAWVLWEYVWKKPPAGPARLMVRATDKNGRSQPAERDVDRRSYMISHIMPVDVVVR
jgi:DMSO/TMAO reductase YedYZ molybdopterin-dependent catalytic subunit